MIDTTNAECFKSAVIAGWYGPGGDCKSNGHYICLECGHLERLPLGTPHEECTGCLRPVDLCVCPPLGIQIFVATKEPG
jgi:hypothetical protein